MFFRHLKNVLSRQDNWKTNLRCLEDVLHRLGNTFFSNIVSNLKIAESINSDPVSDNINDPVIKSSVKYRNHPSILKIGEVCNRKQCSLFSFSHVDKEEILKEILSLDSTKVSQDTDIPTKIIKDNADIFFRFSSFRF